MNIIINADDFGKSDSVNLAITDCFRKKYISNTTVMVNMPGFEAAIRMSVENGFFDSVGLHLNLTEGVPLTENIRNESFFCSTDGVFHGNFQNILRNRFSIRKGLKECCRNEIVAQVEKYMDVGFTLKHIDSHHHVHNDLSILTILLPIIDKYDFRSMRICRNMYAGRIWNYKGIYKFIINKKIRSRFFAVDYFGSYSDFVTYSQKKENLFYEIMLHPVWINENIYDRINDNKIELISSYDSFSLNKLVGYDVAL